MIRLRVASLGMLILPLALSAQTIAISGGKVYPVSGPPLERGTVLIRDGRIAAVGVDVAIPAGAQRIDATGKVVTPGFINGATLVGLDEIGSISSTRESVARGRVRRRCLGCARSSRTPGSIALDAPTTSAPRRAS